MSTCYFDCPAGASGDMILSAFVSAGFPARTLRDAVAALGLDEVTVRVSKTSRNGVVCRQLTVGQKAKVPELRVLPGIRKRIEAAGLPERVVTRSLAVFERLAKAEAKIHGIPMEKVHFHEIGAADTIVDIVGAALALEHFEVDRIVASPLPMGRGTISFSHGTLPLPAPAAADLLKGKPVYSIDVEGETVTPTGAAILSTLAARFGSMPAMRVRAIGYGAGSREYPDSANLLRVLVGDEEAGGVGEEVSVIVEAAIDDMVPEQFAHLAERLAEAGAQDVTLTPTMMKKGRPGTIVTAIGPTRKLDPISRALLTESTTIGLRHWTVGRRVLPREVVRVKTEYGAIAIKVARWGGRVANVAPEYDDCRAAARKHRVTLKSVYAAALRAAAKKGLVADPDVE